jgi:phosphoserine phosphatase
MNNVLTLVAAKTNGLNPSIVAEASAALNALIIKTGGTKTAVPVWLAEKQACDIPFNDAPLNAAQDVARDVINGAAIDFHVQNTADRRKKLLLADMDSTIVTAETLDELAAFAGLKDEIAAITARAMNGELDFEAAIKERVGMLSGLPESTLAAAYDDIELNPGAECLVRTMSDHGARCVLVSGGFKYFTTRVAARCGFHLEFANDFIIEGGKLTGRIVEPILNKDTKLHALQTQSAELGLQLSNTLAVGDGANDLPMIQAAGLGVAFHGKPVVAEAAAARVDHGVLTALLYYQGYTRREFTNA